MPGCSGASHLLGTAPASVSPVLHHIKTLTGVFTAAFSPFFFSSRKDFRCPLGTKLGASRRNPSSAAPKGRVLAQPAGRVLGWWRRLSLPRVIADGAQIPSAFPSSRRLQRAGSSLGEDKVGVKSRVRDGTNQGRPG